MPTFPRLSGTRLQPLRSRHCEIGLRKAVGARYRDIRNQFLFEALQLSEIGSLLELLFGIGSVAGGCL
jgi:putative ABC transport system permease protein